MTDPDTHYKRVIAHYNALAEHGPFATLAPNNKGGGKSRYVAAVFDAALLPRIKEISPCERILDFGCGTGIFTQQIATYATEVVGIDVSPGLLQQAARVCAGADNIRFLETDSLRIPLPDYSVSCVVAREVLCYAPDESVTKSLREIYRVTRPGGRFLWLEQVSDNPYWQRHPSAPNLVKRSPETIRSLTTDVGWQMQSEQVVRTPRFPWVYAAWLGLIPQSMVRRLARSEVNIHARFRHHSRRWFNCLFVLRKPSDG